MREDAVKLNNFDVMQAWTGQSAKLAKVMPAKEIVTKLWNEAQSFLN
jgi:hypothetical protein